ncbi:MAG: hypothetical protein EPN97_14855 [Alphaproteobacteria bacterium]|nr:MAG: hypothetical protein EPN97_14855 [Alphaproteobacteria bacterium]
MGDVKESRDWIIPQKFSPSRHNWLKAARGEHSSVAAFSELSLKLSQLGCPPDLLAGTHQAALDEIRHAQIAFTLDAANGTPKGPAEARGLFGRAGYLFRIHKMAAETFADGCLNEALSAQELKTRAQEEPDAAIKAELNQIAREEDTHVELSWKIVKWCFGELRDTRLRARLFKHLSSTLAAAESRSTGRDSAIFEKARESLNEIYAR